MAAMPQPALTIKRIEVFGDDQDNQIFTSLSKGKQEEAEFFSKRDLTIKFDAGDGTPFRKGDTFQVSAGQATHSGPLKDEAEVGKHYRYRVIPMKGGGAGADPTIIITN